MARTQMCHSGCCRPQVEWSRALGCLPLAAVGLLISTGLLALGAFEIARAVTSRNWAGWMCATCLGLAIYKVLWSMVAEITILFRVKFLARPILVDAYRILLFTSLLSFALIWAEFGRDLVDGWAPSDMDVVRMTIHTTVYLVIFIFCLWTASVLTSLQMIIAVGGSGWEYESYKEFRILKILIDGKSPCNSMKSDDEVDIEPATHASYFKAHAVRDAL